MAPATGSDGGAKTKQDDAVDVDETKGCGMSKNEVRLTGDGEVDGILTTSNRGSAEGEKLKAVEPKQDQTGEEDQVPMDGSDVVLQILMNEKLERPQSKMEAGLKTAGGTAMTVVEPEAAVTNPEVTFRTHGSSSSNNNNNGQDGLHPFMSQLNSVGGTELRQPALYRTQGGAQVVSQPGAYAAGVGGRIDPRSNLDLSLVGNHPEAPATSGLTTAVVDPQLAQARQVDDENPEEDLPRAQMYDPNTPKTNRQQTQQNRAIGILIVVAMLALLLGLYFGVKANSQPSQAQSEEDEEESYLIPLTPNPSFSPSTAPSGIMDDLFEILPPHTHTSLQNYSSPQFQAWQWLENHHNITGMPTWHKEQLFAMATFFYSMNGTHWIDLAKETWMDDEVSECLWFSTVDGMVNVDGSWDPKPRFGSHTAELLDFADLQPTNCDGNGRINAIALRRSLQGVENAVVPPEISMLSSLVMLDLSLNFLEGGLESILTPQVYQLTDLEYLDIEKNWYTGSLPTSIGRLSNLKILSTGYNIITGSIPSEIGLVTGLVELEVARSHITGTLPTELGNLRNLTDLDAHQNTLLSGSLPTELGQCQSLEDIFLYGCPFLSGPIPSEFGKATRLKWVSLYDDSLTGTLPTELGLLTNMRSLRFSNNSLHGSIPSELGAMEASQYIDLYDNDLAGTIPIEILRLERLVSLSLGSNPLSGPIPSQIGLSHRLIWLYLVDTHLSGFIPSEIGMLTAVRELYLSNNPFLTGPLPTEIGKMVDLRELELANNTGLTGTLPSELGVLVSAFNVTVVDIRGSSNMTGETPGDLCFLQNPNCTYKLYWWQDPIPCMFEFDCLSALCGCECDCPGK